MLALKLKNVHNVDIFWISKILTKYNPEGRFPLSEMVGEFATNSL